MQLEINDKVPEIKTKAYFPEEKEMKDFSLGDYKGKWVILTFYPGDFTFVCATDVEALTKKYDEFVKNNAYVFGISTDSIFSHKVWSETSPRASKSRIPLIDDFTKKITEEYGFLNKETGAARRGLVIIDPEQRLQYFAIYNDGLGKDVEHIFSSFMGLKFMQDNPASAGHACAIPANWKPGEKTLDIDINKDAGKL